MAPSDRKNGDIQQDYAGAGFGNRLGFGQRPALLIIDFVMAYLEPSSPLYADFSAELAINQTLLAAARTAEIPVFFTNVVYMPGGADGGHFYRKVKSLRVFDRGSPLGEFHPALKPRPEETIVSKQYASAFFGTSLASTLVSMRVDTVICTGLTTSGCVRASALDALQHGFIPIVARDACGDRQAAIHEANLFDLEAKYADVLPAQEIIAWLARRK